MGVREGMRRRRRCVASSSLLGKKNSPSLVYVCVLLRTHQILYPRETFVRGEKHQLSRERKSDCSNENVESSLYRNIAAFHLLSLRGQFRKVEWRGLVYELSSGKLR